jgi:hypothetical protein
MYVRLQWGTRILKWVLGEFAFFYGLDAHFIAQTHFSPSRAGLSRQKWGLKLRIYLLFTNV